MTEIIPVINWIGRCEVEFLLNDLLRNRSSYMLFNLGSSKSHHKSKLKSHMMMRHSPEQEIDEIPESQKVVAGKKHF